MMSATFRIFDRIAAKFPQQFSIVFAYGSSVFPQTNTLRQNDKDAMLDLIFCVDDPLSWHRANLQCNRNQYSLIKYFGAEFITHFQEHIGASVYYNTLIRIENKLIKYGVVSSSNLIEDLLDWKTLYLSGRLHKPVKFIKCATNPDLQQALHTNLQSALHTALLCLPESFSEEELYMKIAELSYRGDFRMYFGEDKQKVKNIVYNQMPYFRNLYSDHLKCMPLLHWNPSQNIIEQDDSNATILHHLNLLPKSVQRKLLLHWNKDGKYRDLEEVLQVIAHEPECSDVVQQAVQDIVWWPSISQGAKGILTAGILKSVKYSSRKIRKMMKSWK